MKKFNHLLTTVAAGLLVLSVAGCGNSAADKGGSSSASTDSEATTAAQSGEKVDVKTANAGKLVWATNAEFPPYESHGTDGSVEVDHAGLECSIILGKYPHLDVVSMGPTMKSPHTTTERCFIPSIEPFWKLLRQALEEIPAK